MYLKLRYFVFLLVLINCFPVKNFAQRDRLGLQVDPNENEERAFADSIPASDTIFVDTLSKSDNFIDTKIIYNAEDSIVLSQDSEKIYLYKKSRVEYGDIVLEAYYIEYDQKNNFVFAKGRLDSLGNLEGKPQFKDQGDEFIAKTIKYNFKTKKGYIEEVFTEEEQGFLHSEQTNKLQDNSFLLKNGKYTTCELEDHPHFYLKMSKAKVIPNDKIVSGPAYLVMEDIPFKVIGVPFGFFPNQSEYSSGIMIPKYGEETNRGFFLQDGGYYFGISDKMDLAVSGDIFSKGSWGGDVKYNFVKRYKFRSNFNFSYAVFATGDKDLPETYKQQKDLAIRWNHTQDPKANPNTKFSARVDYSTTSYDQFNSKSIEQLATSQKSSNITYGKNWPGSPFRFNMNLRHSQNTNSNNISLTLPQMTLSMDRQYPFRNKKSSGDSKWYEDIEIQYSSKFENKISTADSLLFNGTSWSDFENGFQHTIPLSTNFKILQHFNLSPRVEYTGILYSNSYKQKYYDYNALNEETDTYGVLFEEEANSLKYAQLIKPSISLSVGPNVYGMYQLKNPDAKLVAVRHVVTPSAGISFTPDMGGMVDKYYKSYEVFDGGRRTTEYSIFENELYAFPAAPGKSGTVSLGLNNTLEMKVRSEKDTANTTKKIKLLEGLKISTSYNLFADSLNWSPISINGRTSMFENKLNFNFGASVDPYAIDSILGFRYNEFQWDTKKGGWGRLTRVDFTIDIKLESKKKEKEEGTNQSPGARENVFDEFDNRSNMGQYPTIQDQIVTYVDFDIPWSLSLNYKFLYSKPKFEDKITQTMSLSGNISLTKKWKLSFRANYDLVEDKLSSTSININRDLHCWEMTFSWIPIGRLQSYNFQINVKGSTLRDFLKYDKRKSWQDNL